MPVVEKKKTINDYLQDLRTSGLEHVCFDGYQNIHSAYQSRVTLHILTPVSQSVSNLLGLNRQFKVSELSRNNEVNITVRLYDKGKATFPERFETELLRSRIVLDNLIWIPDNNHEFLVRLYLATVYQKSFDSFDIGVIRRELQYKVGALIKGRYK